MKCFEISPYLGHFYFRASFSRWRDIFWFILQNDTTHNLFVKLIRKFIAANGIMILGESLQQMKTCPWALTLTKQVPETFEFLPSDWRRGSPRRLCHLCLVESLRKKDSTKGRKSQAINRLLGNNTPQII